jgi:hypothetical protein
MISIFEPTISITGEIDYPHRALSPRFEQDFDNGFFFNTNPLAFQFCSFHGKLSHRMLYAFIKLIDGTPKGDSSIVSTFCLILLAAEKSVGDFTGGCLAGSHLRRE